ncbi:MAG: TetR/AcrR family transcriptional regulator [Phenylobacterium sp.]|uniref:TetR/AcrR family transcriptional regulator n=1 Tax=Phenylobacterium sp. TaxID=1871053 RepID=UPI0026162D2E|nr:TetR/AcrR family transcriptional regulator [Phenylobacterium sp.]MDB5497297.1 TetR/AcrR family transcriptional regulator [Phenylobacterium sp.]
MNSPRSRRDDLLDAAERLFADRGFYGASMRDIAREARVQLGLSTYYFTTKEQLYQEVLRRRGEDLVALLEDSLRELCERRPRPTVAEIMEAFIVPHVRRVAADAAWRRYSQILYQLAAFEERRSLGAWLFPPHERVLDLYVEALGGALPGAEPRKLRIAMLFARQLKLGFIVNMSSESAAPDPARLSLDVLPQLVDFARVGVVAAAAAEAVPIPQPRRLRTRR